ncbi:MAG: hypothetical protein ACREIC_22835, partial [Limisphaerales bacterium]
MKTDGHDFLEQLETFPPASFEGKFLKTSTRLRLGCYLSAEELSRLYRAAFRSALCNIAFNGLGGCELEVKPDQEPNRRRLEIEFMIARDRFLESDGWATLPKLQRGSIQRSFLTVV